MAWSSYHLHLDDGLGAVADDFLVKLLWPEVCREQESGRLRRFFFLRYSEGGPHLRLRFQTRDGGVSSSFENWLAACAERVEGRLETHTYDRSRHYFGERPESVYAELLNTATSRLALALMEQFEAAQRGVRWIALTCSLGLLLEASCASSEELTSEIDASRAFALDAGSRLGIGPNEAGEAAGQRWAATVQAAWPRVAAGLPAELLRPTASLLRRARRRGEEGRSVASHALHLLCNKSGFSLQEEHEAFATLATLRPVREGHPS